MRPALALALLALLVSPPVALAACAAGTPTECVAVTNARGNRRVELTTPGGASASAGTYDEYGFSGYAVRVSSGPAQILVEQGEYRREVSETRASGSAAGLPLFGYYSNDDTAPAPDNYQCLSVLTLTVQRCGAPLIP